MINKNVRWVFMDLKIVYDRAYKKAMCNVLLLHGVEEKLLSTVTSFSSTSKIRVKVENELNE